MVDQVTLRQFLRAFGLFAVSFSLGLGVWMHMLDGVGWLILAGHVSAILSCLWAGAAVVLPRGGAHAPTSLAQIPALAALVAGTVAAVMQAVILTIRLIGVAVELSAVSPWFASGRVGFWPGGVWAFGLVGAACLLGLVRTRDRRLWVCLFWCVVLGLVWDAVAGPAICRTQTGSWMRTGVSFDLLVRLSAAMVVGVAWTRWVRFPSSGCWSGDDKRWPGFDASCVVLALAVSALAGFHLAVPFSGWGGGLRSATILTAVSAGMGALALYTLLRRRFGVGLCDAGMALSSLALASVVVAAVPNEPTDLSRRYPLVFAAMMIGFAAASAIWAWLATRWAGRIAVADLPLPQRLWVRAAGRSSFLSAALALVVAALLAVWPRLSSIATMDHALPQVRAGFAANLFMLLSLLYAARLARRHTFHILTGLAVVAVGGYMVARVLPFASGLG